MEGNKNIEDRISSLEKKVEKMIELLENNIEPNCSKMNHHISFVENVYSSWRHPITWILSKINREAIQSPEIKRIKEK